MKLRKCKLTSKEIVSLYNGMTRVNDIAELAGISRQGVFNILKDAGVTTYKRKSVEVVCQFCKERFTKYHTNVSESNYCSSQCFHASHSVAGMYSNRGSGFTPLSDKAAHRKLSGIARKTVMESGIILEPGQVVHHINGDRNDNRIENLRVFNSHSEHMRFHHNANA